MKKFGDLGVQVMITEMDVNLHEMSGTLEERARAPEATLCRYDDRLHQIQGLHAVCHMGYWRRDQLGHRSRYPCGLSQLHARCGAVALRHGIQSQAPILCSSSGSEWPLGVEIWNEDRQW